MRLVVSELRKDFHRRAKSRGENDRPALNGVSLSIEDGDFFTLLGPSGCGKTTLLRCIAGLEVPDGGEIRLGHTVLFSSSARVNVPPNRRGLGMVFQSYAIWPHLDAAANVAYPLTVGARRRRYSRAEVDRRVAELLDLIQIGHLAKRKATMLSGGEQQRLAVARALVMEPPVLLLDEPLSNLDSRLRQELRVELIRLQKTLGLTSVYVTHDQSEALAMSSSVAVMREGVIEQLGTPEESYDYPRTRFVASFLGSANLLKARVIAVRNAGVENGTECFRFEVATEWGAPVTAFGRVPFAAGDEVTAAVRPEGVRLASSHDGRDPASDPWAGVVETVQFLGDAVEYRLKIRDRVLRSRCNRGCQFKIGDWASIELWDKACTIVTD
jgi:iron(III) transport system ATP-binding protein